VPSTSPTHSLTSPTDKDAGFRGVWRRVKPRDKPEEGMPFDTEDAMFNSPLLMSGRPSVSLYEYDPAGANMSDRYESDPAANTAVIRPQETN
jgi:hypothetical protein